MRPALWEGVPARDMRAAMTGMIPMAEAFLTGETPIPTRVPTGIWTGIPTGAVTGIRIGKFRTAYY